MYVYPTLQEEVKRALNPPETGRPTDARTAAKVSDGNRARRSIGRLRKRIRGGSVQDEVKEHVV